MGFVVAKLLFYHNVCLSVCPCFTGEHTGTDKDFGKKALKTDNVLSKVKKMGFATLFFNCLSDEILNDLLSKTFGTFISSKIEV